MTVTTTGIEIGETVVTTMVMTELTGVGVEEGIGGKTGMTEGTTEISGKTATKGVIVIMIIHTTDETGTEIGEMIGRETLTMTKWIAIMIIATTGCMIDCLTIGTVWTMITEILGVLKESLVPNLGEIILEGRVWRKSSPHPLGLRLHPCPQSQLQQRKSQDLKVWNPVFRVFYRMLEGYLMDLEVRQMNPQVIQGRKNRLHLQGDTIINMAIFPIGYPKHQRKTVLMLKILELLLIMDKIIRLPLLKERG